MDAEFLTASQAAKLCNVAPKTILYWWRHGKICGGKMVRGIVRLPKEEVVRANELSLRGNQRKRFID